MMSKILKWLCYGVAGAFFALFLWAIADDIKNDLNRKASPLRYDCEDNSDTTKGHYKGVLTHCVPVEITRTM